MKKLLIPKRRSGSFSKLSLKMKLSTIIILATFFSLQANTSYSQRTKITLNMDNVPVKLVLDQIETNTDFRFVYKLKDVDLNKKVNVKVEDELVTAVMDRIFKNSGTSYYVIDQQIFLVQKKIAGTGDRDYRPIDNILPQIEITGNVTDQDGAPLPGASIIEKGTTNGTQSDFDGNFTLSVSEANAVLVVSYLGFSTKEVALAGKQDISISLLESSDNLDEVVVTALGISREKKGLGYAVQEIQGGDLNEARESNFVNSLAGKVAGVNISSAGGVGSSSRIVIRGESSLNFGGNQPLYVIDGVPTGNAGTSNSTTADYGSSSAEINPADIESVTVLKGLQRSYRYHHQIW